MSRKNNSKILYKIAIIFFAIITVILAISLIVFFREYNSGKGQQKILVVRKVVNLKSVNRTVYGASTVIQEKNYKWSGTINKIESSKIYLSANFEYKNKNYTNQEIIAIATPQIKIIRYNMGQSGDSQSISFSDLKENDKIIVEAENNMNDKFEIQAIKVSLLITAAK